MFVHARCRLRALKRVRVCSCKAASKQYTHTHTHHGENGWHGTELATTTAITAAAYHSNYHCRVLYRV